MERTYDTDNSNIVAKWMFVAFLFLVSVFQLVSIWTFLLLPKHIAFTARRSVLYLLCVQNVFCWITFLFWIFTIQRHQWLGNLSGCQGYLFFFVCCISMIGYARCLVAYETNQIVQSLGRHHWTNARLFQFILGTAVLSVVSAALISYTWGEPVLWPSHLFCGPSSLSIGLFLVQILISLGMLSGVYFHMLRFLHNHVRIMQETKQINRQSSLNHEQEVDVTEKVEAIVRELVGDIPFQIQVESTGPPPVKAQIPVTISPLHHPSFIPSPSLPPHSLTIHSPISVHRTSPFTLSVPEVFPTNDGSTPSLVSTSITVVSPRSTSPLRTITPSSIPFSPQPICRSMDVSNKYENYKRVSVRILLYLLGLLCCWVPFLGMLVDQWRTSQLESAWTFLSLFMLMAEMSANTFFYVWLSSNVRSSIGCLKRFFR